MQPVSSVDPSLAAQQLLERLKHLYADMTTMPLDQIHQVYDKDILFRDPVHQLRGIDALHAYLLQSCQPLNEGRFEFLDQLLGEESAYLKWNMHFRHPKMNNKLITVRGMSHLQFSERIYFHEDSYDMGEMLYEHLPLLGGATRWLKRRLSPASVRVVGGTAS